MDDALRIALDAGLPYTGLRGFEVDPRLWHYVPQRLAVTERIVPVILVGSTLTIAATHPDPDLSHLRDAFPNLQLSVAIAPAPEIDHLLGQLDPTPDPNLSL